MQLKLSGLSILLLTFVGLIGSCLPDDDLTNRPGHLKPFGQSGSSSPIDEVEGFPDVKDFFKKYVIGSVPLKMTGAAKFSPGFDTWNDDYFLSLDVPADNEVLVETKKKENRNQKTEMMNFKDFVRSYNGTEKYMVNSVPDFLRKDITIPGPLQCAPIYEKSLVEGIIWFSSGGTKSVVHTDAVDNINCVYRGSKQFVMIGSDIETRKAIIDYPDGAYSGIDVDKVDLTRYPVLANMHYYHVNLSEGDCLFIPYKWIHQVRSFNRNIAVNIWWDNNQNEELNLDECTADFDPQLTLEHAKFGGFEKLETHLREFRERLQEETYAGSVTYEQFKKIIMGDTSMMDHELIKQSLVHVKAIYDILDMTGDGNLSNYELNHAKEEEWNQIQDIMKEVNRLLDVIEQEVEDNEEGDLDPNKDQDKSEDDLVKDEGRDEL